MVGDLVVRSLGERAAFVGRRQEHLYARVRARLSADGIGGLSVRIDPRHALDLEVADGVVRAGGRSETSVTCWVSARSSGELDLGLRMAPTEVFAGGMTGRLVGVRCSRGTVVLRAFECVGFDDRAAAGGGPDGPQPSAR